MVAVVKGQSLPPRYWPRQPLQRGIGPKPFRGLVEKGEELRWSHTSGWTMSP